VVSTDRVRILTDGGSSHEFLQINHKYSMSAAAAGAAGQEEDDVPPPESSSTGAPGRSPDGVARTDAGADDESDGSPLIIHTV
jgi:hypothetical protein